ncbi:MAG: YceI family protein [Acidimicrobiia bacterium]|jgi:polyisoprenoid-binding protein YceI
MASTQTQTHTSPRPLAGTYAIDPGHSGVAFTGRHLMVSKVRGKFAVTGGTIVVADDLALSSVDATIDAASVESGDPRRDEHLRSGDFFAVEDHPTITFRSTQVEDHGDGEFTLSGDLTVRGVTRPVTLRGEHLGSAQSPWNTTVVGFTARTVVNRKDWGLEWNMALEAGGVLVGDKVTLDIDVEAVLQDAPQA